MSVQKRQQSQQCEWLFLLLINVPIISTSSSPSCCSSRPSAHFYIRMTLSKLLSLKEQRSQVSWKRFYMTRRVGMAYDLSTRQRKQRHLQSMKGDSWFQDSTSESDESRHKDTVEHITRNMESMYGAIKKDRLLKRTAKEKNTLLMRGKYEKYILHLLMPEEQCIQSHRVA